MINERDMNLSLQNFQYGEIKGSSRREQILNYLCWQGQSKSGKVTLTKGFIFQYPDFNLFFVQL